MIYQKLMEIQKELFVPKGQKNDFGKYNYRSCEDILKTAKPICEKNGCVLFITNDLVNVGDRNYVKAVAKLVEIESGESIESTAHAREEAEKKGMDGSQITGSASSYARKYALAGLFCIDNEKDSDATNDGGKEAPKQVQAKQAPKLASKEEVDTVLSLYTDIPAMLKYYKINDVSQLTSVQAQTLIRAKKNKKGE